MADRYLRQQRLAEIGEAGQAAFARAECAVAGADAAAAVEAAYLKRAGVGSVRREPDAEPPPFVHAGVFRHDAALAVGAGAWRATRTLFRILPRAPT